MKRVAFIAVLAGAITYPVVAFAEPVSAYLATTALITSLSAATGITAAGLATGITYGALTAASVGYSLLTAGRRQGARPQDIKNTTKGKEGPGRYSFGRVEIAAQIGFGNTKDYSIYRLLFHSFGPLDGVEEYIYSGKEVVVGSNGDVESPPWAKPGGSYMNLKTAVGDGTEQAWPDLIADFPDLWTTEHRAQGIAQTLLRVTNPGVGSDKFAKILNAGLQELKIRARMGAFYDPRDGSEKWSINGVLHCLYYWREMPGLTDDDIDLEGIAAVASQGEVLVPTLTGAAARCLLSGGWQGPLTMDIIDEMLESAGLEIIMGDSSKYTLSFVEDNPVPEITYLARHLISIDLKSGPDSGQRYNICKLEYFSPERRYEVSEIDLSNAAWASVPDEIASYGEQELRLVLKFCCDASQAQRIARRIFHMSRADFGTIITNFSGIAAWGMRTAMIEFPDVGEDGTSVFKECVIDSVRVDDGAGTCEIPYQIIPDILKTPWNPATDEQPAPPVLLLGQYETELDTPVAPSQAITVQYPDGSFEVRVAITPVDNAALAEATYRTYAGGQPGGWVSMTEDGLNLATLPISLVGLPADFRVRFFDGNEEGSHLSELLAVPNVAIDNTPVSAPGIGVAVGATATITIAADIQVVAAKVQYRKYTDSPSGSWNQIHDRHVRPSDVYTIQANQTPAEGETIAYRVIARTSDGTETISVEFTHEQETEVE